MESQKLTRVEITQRQRERAKILKKYAKNAGFQPVQVWMRNEVKAALDDFIEMNSQFDMNDFLDAVLTYSLREDHSLNVSEPENEIDPENSLFRIGAYITNKDGKRIGWRKFNDAKLEAEVEIAEHQGAGSGRVRQLVELIKKAKVDRG